MKKSELKRIIREEISRLDEEQPIDQPIVVKQNDAKKARKILDRLKVDYTQDKNEFLIPSSDEWNDSMEAFEENGIELDN